MLETIAVSKKVYDIAQAVGRQPLIAEECICTKINPYGICGG